MCDSSNWLRRHTQEMEKTIRWPINMCNVHEHRHVHLKYPCSGIQCFNGQSRNYIEIDVSILYLYKLVCRRYWFAWSEMCVFVPQWPLLNHVVSTQKQNKVNIFLRQNFLVCSPELCSMQSIPTVPSNIPILRILDWLHPEILLGVHCAMCECA